MNCTRCLKPSALCICEFLPVEKLVTQKQVMILQHPQEPDKLLGTAHLATLCLKHSALKIALSLSNLKKLTQDEKSDPKRWLVLYLGSGIKAQASTSELTLVDKKGIPLAPQEQSLVKDNLEGIILLDGTWSQAKALWWRNAWLLKCRRGILQLKTPSLYRELRKEPRRECLSTLETIGATLTALGENPEIEITLKTVFNHLLQKRRAQLKSPKT
jgi:DTW domain-containing protein YfiP